MIHEGDEGANSGTQDSYAKGMIKLNTSLNCLKQRIPGLVRFTVGGLEVAPPAAAPPHFQ